VTFTVPRDTVRSKLAIAVTGAETLARKMRKVRAGPIEKFTPMALTQLIA
jgi:hypothetical protein